MRLGVVLAAAGGMLPRVLRPMRFGLGGWLGNGRQWVSWISLEDVCGAVEHLLQSSGIAGAVNLTAPQPVTNRQFVQTLGRLIHRPAWLPAPTWALRLALGRQMVDELLLASTRATPRRLQQSGYRFVHPDLESALRGLLKV